MLASGELFLLNGETGGELQPSSRFLNQNIRVIAANFDRAYVACEPPVSPDVTPKQPCTVWRFQGDNLEPILCQEFDAVEGHIRQIAVGGEHLLVLTDTGTVYSRGEAVYGNTGHGGACHVPEFKAVPALKNRQVKLVAAGPHFSIVVTQEGDVFSWGKGFNGETGVFVQVESVPRFAPAVTPFRLTEISCGNAHVLARTESQHCVSWGENVCGQLGLGCKSKPTYKPQVLDAIPSQILCVSAGWAHSIAIGTDNRAYAWGLNSHGQLGLGDTETRLAPHLLHDLVDMHEVVSSHAARALTVFRTSANRALFCGRVPCGPNSKMAPGAFPRRSGEPEHSGCILLPAPLTLASGAGFGGSHSELSQVIAFDNGAVGFARSTVYRVSPNLAPVQGGTQVQANVTGLPFERPSHKKTSLVQDNIPVKVRLKSSSPLCDVVVPGRIVDVDTVEFTSPNVTNSPLGSVVEQGTTCSVQLRVSIDDGFTWTPDRHGTNELDKTSKSQESKSGTQGIKDGLQDLKSDFEKSRRINHATKLGSTVLWYCRWPRDGPTHVEPSCAPIAGNTELLLHVQLPSRMPTDALTVKFVCTPLSALADPELEAKAPMRDDAKNMTWFHEGADQLPLAGELEIPVSAWLDPGGRGVRCISPPLNPESFNVYEYSVELSLDGRMYLNKGLPFNVFDLNVVGLSPNVGPLLEPTEVQIKATGLVDTNTHRVRIDFPEGRPSRTLPANYDCTTGIISFIMPELSSEVREKIDEAAQVDALIAERLGISAAPEEDEGGGEGGGEGGEAAGASAEPVDPSGGLHGLEVFVELSLNGQNYTSNRVPGINNFIYYGPLEVGTLKVLAPPEGVTMEPPKEDPKAKGKKGGAEESAEPIVIPGAKLGCTVQGIMDSEYAVLRAEIMTKTGEEEIKLWKVMDLPAKYEYVVPESQPQEDHPKEEIDKKAKGKKSEVQEEKEEEKTQIAPYEILSALAPEIDTVDLQPDTAVYLCNFQASLNGQSFTPCTETPPLKLDLGTPENRRGSTL